LAREIAASGPPPLGSLVADAVTTGLRRRRLRRYTVAASGAVALVLTLTVGMLLRPGGEVATPAGPGPTTSAAGAAKPATGQAVVALLLDLLPPGGDVSEVEYYAADGIVSGGLLYDDGHGAATVSAGLSARAAEYGTTGMQCPPNGNGFVCVHDTRPGGIEVRVMTMGPYTSPDCDMTKCSLQELRVEIRRPDGVYVTLDTYNGPFGHGRGATRAHTLLDADQLYAFATDPRWGLTMDASFVDKAARTVHQS
jgi:hypothetical protein